MAEFKFVPGAPELWEIYDWHKVDRSHAWKMVEYLTAHIAEDDNCPEPLKSWFLAAWDYARNDPARWLVALGLETNMGPRKKAGLISVGRFIESELSNGSKKVAALKKAGKLYKITPRTARSYYNKYVRARDVE